MLPFFFTSCSEKTSGPPAEGVDGNSPYSHNRQACTAAHDFLSGKDFSHLVIDIGYMSGYDTENGHHCNNESCLMYYATHRTDLIAGSLSGDEIPSQNANCLADLEANGGK